MSSRQMHETLRATCMMLRDGASEASALEWATQAVSCHGRCLVQEETVRENEKVVADPRNSAKKVRVYTAPYTSGMQVYLTNSSVKGGPSHALLCTNRWLRLKVMQQRYSYDNWSGHSMATYHGGSPAPEP